MTGSPVHTVSLGCRLNRYESERMAALASAGQGNAGDGTAAKVIVNTCAVTAEAVRQSRQAIRRAHKDHPDAEIIATGCAADLDPEGFAALPAVTRVVPNQEKLSPAQWGAEGNALPQRVMARAPLEVQNGCDHRCTFCIIPFGRGDARSKPLAEISEEAAALVERGAAELVLTGVDLTSYGPDLGPDVRLADAVQAVLDATPADIQVRLSSIDGAEVDEALFALLTQEQRIAPYLHLSLQSGDDMILKRMKRRHSRAQAVELCQRIRAARSEVAFGADVIAGFPTETDEMFENSLSLINDCGLAYCHVFPYSPREGTPAARMPQLPKAVIKERAYRLREAAAEVLADHLAEKVGQEHPVLIESVKDNGQSVGKTPDFTDVALHDAHVRPGQWVLAEIETVADRSLLGTMTTALRRDENLHGE